MGKSNLSKKMRFVCLVCTFEAGPNLKIPFLGPNTWNFYFWIFSSVVRKFRAEWLFAFNGASAPRNHRVHSDDYLCFEGRRSISVYPKKSRVPQSIVITVDTLISGTTLGKTDGRQG
jgi:hypothetical protein